jgi:hypothetical protein
VYNIGNETTNRPDGARRKAMKFITERKEIAAAVNFGKYPVVYVEDVDKTKTEYGWNLGKVKIKHERGYYIHADLYLFEDNKLAVVSYGSCLSERFAWSDVAEMAKNANAPELKPNDKFVLVVGMKNVKNSGFVMLIETGDAQFGTMNPVKIINDDDNIRIARYMIEHND